MSNSVNRRGIEYVKSNKPFQKMTKRIFDIIFSFITLLVLSPLIFILVILIIKEDGRPVFFKQKRSGLYGEVFEIYKFRSMKSKQVPVASNTHDEYDWKDGVPDNFIFKAESEHNPNITKVGNFIRRYSLDEIPQFFNVLKGDMSIIGPRPEIINISRFYNSYQKKRLEINPGITGLAQVNGRSEINHGKKIKYDIDYVEHFSLWLDLRILLKTIAQVIGGRGSV